MQPLSAFAQQYKDALSSELKTTDRHSISFLRVLAEENKHEALNIIVAVQQHLYESPPEIHLPTLYLVDSIMKLVGEPYVNAFSAALPGMFRFVWDEANADVKRSLVKLAGTWEPLLPTATSTAVGRIIRPPTRPAAPVPPAAAPVPPVAAPTGPRMGVPGHAPPPPQHASPPHASYGHSAAPPPPLRRDPRMPPSTVPLPVPRPPPQPVYGTVPAPQQQSLLAVAPPPTCLQQPVGTSYGMAAHAAPSTIAAAVAPPVAPPSAPFASGKDLMAALVSLGTKLAGNAAGGGAAGGSNGNAGHSAETGLSSSKQQRAPGAGKVIGALDFHASILKEDDPCVVDELLDASEQYRRRFRDRRFLRTRRIKAAQASGTPLSQTWFYGVDDWLRGTKADGEDAGLGMPEDEDAEMAAFTAEEEHNVEEDPSQPECAVCGEPFDRWYDPDTDKWFYSGAVILTGDDAARQGVMDGSIVKLAALAGQPSKLGLASKGLGTGGGGGIKRSGENSAGSDAKRARTDA